MPDKGISHCWNVVTFQIMMVHVRWYISIAETCLQLAFSTNLESFFFFQFEGYTTLRSISRRKQGQIVGELVSRRLKPYHMQLTIKCSDPQTVHTRAYSASEVDGFVGTHLAVLLEFNRFGGISITIPLSLLNENIPISNNTFTQ